MRNIITQNYTEIHKELFNLTTNSTQTYATKNGFEYITSDKTRCAGEKATQHPGWEKIAWLNEFLPTIEDGSFVVYADCDSIFLKDDLKSTLDTLETNRGIGMVKLRGGLGGREIINWFNTGVIFLINSPKVRNYLLSIWNMNEMNEEIAIKKESSSDSNICNLDPKWNCWSNNEKLVSSPSIKTFHGMKYDDKIKAIKDFLNTVAV